MAEEKGCLYRFTLNCHLSSGSEKSFEDSSSLPFLGMTVAEGLGITRYIFAYNSGFKI